MTIAPECAPGYCKERQTCMELLEFMGIAIAKRPLHSMRKKVRMRPSEYTTTQQADRRKEKKHIWPLSMNSKTKMCT